MTRVSPISWLISLCRFSCSDVDPKKFAESMYQWAATLTQSGKNLPFALPLQTDKLPDGFQVCASSLITDTDASDSNSPIYLGLIPNV